MVVDVSAGLATAGNGSRIVPPLAEAASHDRRFITLLNGFRSSGGLHRLAMTQAIRRHAWSAEVIDALPARVAERGVLGITWNHETWVPDFQFDGRGTTKQPVAAVLLELVPSHDPWDLATWWVAPSTWLQHARPIDLLEMAPARVFAAARADRYIARGG